MAQCQGEPPCAFINEVHDFGCPERFIGWGDEPPELLQLYGTETPAEAELVDQLVMNLLVAAGMDDWDQESVNASNETWLLVRRAIRERGADVLEHPPVLRVVWNEELESPWMEVAPWPS